MKNLRIAFVLWAGQEWFGGYNYLRNLVAVLKSFAGDRISPVLFAGRDSETDDLAPFRAMGIDVIIDPVFDKVTRGRRSVDALLFGKDRAAERSFAASGIDVVFEHGMYFGRCFPLPTVAWLGDFQHRNLPDMFSRRAYWKRDIGMRVRIASERTLMVSSNTARDECVRYFRVEADRIHVVRFAVQVDPEALSANPLETTRRYGIAEPFILVPNQFWKHKNYRVVLHALANNNGKRAVVVATGVQHDPRHPSHYSELMDLAVRLGVESRFRHLGPIPYSDVLALMRAARAVLNPSLSEGWSTIVEEARSLGVSLILSDLAVHREQMDDRARFFPPLDSERLASLFQEYFDLPREAVAAFPVDSTARLARFASDFVAVVDAARHSAEHN